MYRGVADLVHDVRVPRLARILRGALRHPVRQELEQAASGPAPRPLRSAARPAAPTREPLTGQTFPTVPQRLSDVSGLKSGKVPSRICT